MVVGYDDIGMYGPFALPTRTRDIRDIRIGLLRNGSVENPGGTKKPRALVVSSVSERDDFDETVCMHHHHHRNAI